MTVLESSGWKQVPIILPCFTATTSSFNLARISTLDPILRIRGARMNIPINLSIPNFGIGNSDWNDSCCLPNALRSVSISSEPNSFCEVLEEF